MKRMEANKIDVMAKISDQMRAVIQKSAELAGEAFDTNAGLDELRANYVKERAFWNEGGPLMERTENVVLSIPDCADVPVRLYYPQGVNDLAPAIVYIHGGGWVLGNPDTHDRITRFLADNTKAVVVSVDYPLSPEAKYPTALYACAAVAEHLHMCGAQYGIDGDDISFAGDSGGANLSLATHLYLRDQRGDASYIRCLLLYYGAYGLRDSASHRLLGGPWDGLTDADWQYYLETYLADVERDSESPYFNVFQADLSRDIPPAYIVAAEFDPLRDDSLALHQILEEHGEPHHYEVYPGVIHAFLHNSRMLDEAHRALDEGSAFFVEQRARA